MSATGILQAIFVKKWKICRFFTRSGKIVAENCGLKTVEPKKSNTGVSPVLLFRRRCFDVCPAEQIVYTDTVKVGKLVKHRYGDVQPSQLIVGICGLMDLQIGGQLFLRKVTVFPQITNSQLFQCDHLRILCRKGYSLIAF